MTLDLIIAILLLPEETNECDIGQKTSPQAKRHQPSPLITPITSLFQLIVAKKWEPGNLVPSRFWGKIRKIEARLGKLAKIRKVETD